LYEANSRLSDIL